MLIQKVARGSGSNAEQHQNATHEESASTAQPAYASTGRGMHSLREHDHVRAEAVEMRAERDDQLSLWGQEHGGRQATRALPYGTRHTLTSECSRWRWA